MCVLRHARVRPGSLRLTRGLLYKQRVRRHKGLRPEDTVSQIKRNLAPVEIDADASERKDGMSKARWITGIFVLTFLTAGYLGIASTAKAADVPDSAIVSSLLAETR